MAEKTQGKTMQVNQAHPILTDTHTFLKVEHLVVQYGTIVALDDVSLEIPANRVTVLIGPSGCGKSTTLRCLNGLVGIERGTITYLDASVQGLSQTDLRRSMGYAIQSVGLMPHLTVEENVDLVPRLLGWDRSKRKERVDKLLALVRLDPEIYRKKYPNELSGGEAQRIGFARALGSDPPVLLMDEPFGAVDPLNRILLQDEFIRIQRQLKKSVVFVTHDLEEAVRLADYLVIMKDGKIVQADTPEQILSSPKGEFVERFLGPERSLQRLTLVTADRCMEKALSGLDSDASAHLPDCSNLTYWQVDEDGAPVCGYTRSEGSIIQKPITSAIHTVQIYSSLKDCMAKILNSGLSAAAVVDERGRLCGEVRFEAIQQISIL
ncbi:ABC transporter ATP-binding protein [Sphaerochaeta sp. PS]|uniref:ABC transporter ATP-binding protein n=1 Tax=Sphaerochaeta sp. PS TaxID=3076336 RepID=UPI0028A4ABC3|nr:ABC transporter ATP-binding protein [Sphaerochaeta sp. PS]MDT4761704.1 ABC transporter ATP-binding protein [Sphaerochaeta sp. PS]